MKTIHSPQSTVHRKSSCLSALVSLLALSVVEGCLLLLPQAAQAATYYAVDGTRQGIQNAINLAKTGDTVVIPQGTWNVSGIINSHDGINIKGAGRDLTILKKADANSNPVFSIKSLSGGNFEFSDLTLYGIGKTLWEQNNESSVMDIGIYTWGKFDGFKIHNCLFTKFASACIRIESVGATVNGHPKGVIYQNNFIDNMYRQPSTGIANGYGVAVTGLDIWEPLQLGTDNAVFVEDNYFERCRHAVSANAGAHYVFRHNTVYNNYYPWSAADAHGKGVDEHGTRSYEIYNNKFSGGIEYDTLNSHPTWAVGIRGGDGVIFNNTFIDGWASICVTIEQYDSGPLTGYTYPVPDQTTDLWLWNNTLNNMPYNEISLGWSTQMENDLSPFLQEGRDYHFAQKPGYIPYTYPHPLVSATIPYGDVSGDGKVSAYDAALTAQAVVGLITLTADQAKAADVSGDGKVSAYDAALIAQRAVGLIEKFPVER